VAIDGGALAFTAAIAFVTGLVFGGAPSTTCCAAI